MIEVNSLRPSGIKRKIQISPLIDGDGATGTDYLVAHFPNGAKLLGMYVLPQAALSANASSTTLDIGIAADGDTVIDGFALTDSQAQGVPSGNMLNSPGTNGGLRILAKGITLFCEIVLQDVDGGDFVIVTEYEDENN